MSFAGLCAGWKGPAPGEIARSCTIISTTPNAVMERLHNRMPAILDDDAVDLWLDPGVTDVATLQLVLQPCPDDLLCTHAVSPLVNSPRNEGPELVVPVTDV